jgi:ribosomal protein S18 acetylase RimI-like enzyme
VREALPEDVGTLVELMDEFYAEAGYVLDRGEARTSFEVLIGEPRLGQVWLVEEDGGEVAGYLVVTFVFAMEHAGSMAVVDDFFVRPAARGRGLGTDALAWVRRECAELGLRAMRVEVGHDNEVAQAVYRRNSFAAVDRRLMVTTLDEPSDD